MRTPLAFVVLALAGGIVHAADYPPVGILQDQLHAHPGDAIARLIAYGGRLLQPRYLSARHDGGGVYTIRIKLEERR
jgi:hypothetical protein